MTAGHHPPLSVLAADSHPLYLIGLAYAIRHSSALELTHLAITGPEALALIQEHRPQVAVLDIRLDGLDARDIVNTLRVELVPTRTLLLAEYRTGELILQSLTAGAHGIVTRHAPVSEVQQAILAIGNGESVLPSDFAPELATALQRRSTSTASTLTDREHEVLVLIAQGESAGAIAARLDIALATARSHIQRLYAKLGVNDRGAAVATAIRAGIIT